MLTFTLNLESKAKPAGMLINGRITQNRSGYSDWKSKANAQLLKQKTKYTAVTMPLTSGQVYGVIITHKVKSLRCGDILNIVGAAMDTLTKAAIIKDDCPTIINRVMCNMTKSTEDSINIDIIQTKSEWVAQISKGVL